MATSPISFGSTTVSTQNLAQQITQDFKQLAGSLQSGDLTGAQKAYSAIQQLLPKQGQNGPQSSSSSNPIANDFKALGQALQSGNLSSAQGAFSQLQNDLKAGAQSTASGLTQGTRRHHGHHHHSAPVQDSDSSSSSTSTASSTSSPSTTSSTTGSNGQVLNILA